MEIARWGIIAFFGKLLPLYIIDYPRNYSILYITGNYFYPHMNINLGNSISPAFNFYTSEFCPTLFKSLRNKNTDPLRVMMLTLNTLHFHIQYSISQDSFSANR